MAHVREELAFRAGGIHCLVSGNFELGPVTLDLSDIGIHRDGSAACDSPLAHLDPSVAVAMLNFGSDCSAVARQPFRDPGVDVPLSFVDEAQLRGSPDYVLK